MHPCLPPVEPEVPPAGGEPVPGEPEVEDWGAAALRSVSRGRHQLRTAAGTHDYVQH